MSMADEFEDISSRLPDFGSVLAQRAAAAKAGVNSTDLPPEKWIDPYKLMLQKKRAMDSGNINPNTVVRWPEEDTKALQDYCSKMGIYGFNSKLHPKIVLAQLKKQFGEDFSGVPLEERCPLGYEKLKVGQKYNPNYPYSETTQHKQILHG
jgi:hypothetical protein